MAAHPPSRGQSASRQVEVAHHGTSLLPILPCAAVDNTPSALQRTNPPTSPSFNCLLFSQPACLPITTHYLPPQTELSSHNLYTMKSIEACSILLPLSPLAPVYSSRR